MALLPLLKRLIAAALIFAGGLGCESQPQHLVLITVDTLRADHIGAYGYEAARTPTLDSLAKESIRFERAYSHASLTQPAIASLLTGRLADEHGVYDNLSKLSGEVRTLAEQLNEAGFETAGFVGNYVLRRGQGFERGFAQYTDEFVSRERLRPMPANHAGILVDGALAWLGEQDPADRLFLWVHFLEPHGPYASLDFRQPATEGELELPRSASHSGRNAIPRYQWVGHGRLAEYMLRYDEEIMYLDWYISFLLEGLRESGMFDDSVVLFAADHGEAFGEDELYCAHGEGLGEALLRVPLLLRVPGQPPAVRSDTVRLVDVMPTLLELLGLDGEGLPGETLLRDIGDRRVVSQSVNLHLKRAWRGLRDEGFEIIQEAGGPSVVRRLAPGGFADQEAVPTEIHQQLSAELERLSVWPEIEEIPLAPQEREALRALGYVE